MEELQYTAATIQAALEKAGRPPMSVLNRRREGTLPIGSVDMDKAKVIFSSEYDGATSSVQMSSRAKPGDYARCVESHGNGVGKSNNGLTLSFDKCKKNASNEMLSSCFLYADLIQSTGHYYNASRTETEDEIKNGYNDTDDKNSDSSEGISSWAPSSSRSNLNDNDVKNIDNDNQSDEQSSEAAEDSSSPSSDSSCDYSSPFPKEKGSNAGRRTTLTSAISVIC